MAYNIVYVIYLLLQNEMLLLNEKNIYISIQKFPCLKILFILIKAKCYTF